ncbi:GIY-YIG nuclease family protein [Paenibacillus hamazuiensis]|uniref:GIY-YIG nuclease family protein n=1 Tax=Paenibacillus hamazuiensis TaxID=2936508 RepID=UPI00200FA552|nr:GIY-YIG nuclease family protein [Paenibacillus hamazuiensis]
MNLTQFARWHGLPSDKRVKVVKHKTGEVDLERLKQLDLIEFYQSLQSKEVFRDCDYILSFIGESDNRFIFMGTYEVKGVAHYDQTAHGVPDNFPYPDFLAQPLHYYTLQKDSFLEEYMNRLVIHDPNRIWHRWLNEETPIPIFEIRPEGFAKPFQGYDEIMLRYNEMKKIMEHPHSNRVWHDMLSHVAGVYLIVDLVDGSQYVGSAYGEEGILGRWKVYARNPSGGNVKLAALLAQDPLRYLQFQYTVLQTLPKTLTMQEVVEVENKFKLKLGTRAFGLNLN